MRHVIEGTVVAIRGDVRTGYTLEIECADGIRRVTTWKRPAVALCARVRAHAHNNPRHSWEHQLLLDRLEVLDG